MNFSTFAYTNVGKRKNNEDYFLYNDRVWILADGLGGHDSGEVASKTASEAVREYIRENGIPFSTETFLNIIKAANLSLLEKQREDENLAAMRTTIVFAATNGERLRFANVGDSRFYYFKRGCLYVQSEDHSVSAVSARMGDISYDEIRKDPDRNKLIKVLGDKPDLNVKIPDIEISVEKGDAFLLCSDGFWEYVYETEMETDLTKSLNAEEWMKYMLKRVLLRTQNEDNDNFTAVAVMAD